MIKQYLKKKNLGTIEHYRRSSQLRTEYWAVAANPTHLSWRYQCPIYLLQSQLCTHTDWRNQTFMALAYRISHFRSWNAHRLLCAARKIDDLKFWLGRKRQEWLKFYMLWVGRGIFSTVMIHTCRWFKCWVSLELLALTSQNQVANCQTSSDCWKSQPC